MASCKALRAILPWRKVPADWTKVRMPATCPATFASRSAPTVPPPHPPHHRHFHAGAHLVRVPRARCGPAARAALVLAASRSARDVRALRAHLGALFVLRRAKSTLVPLLTVWTEALVH